MIEDLRQNELDIFEQKVLDRIFGGHTPAHFEIGKGIFKISIADDVQKYIDRFENLVRPLMDEQGKIDGSEIKQYLKGDLACIVPEGKFRIVDVYDAVVPLINNIVGAMK